MKRKIKNPEVVESLYHVDVIGENINTVQADPVRIKELEEMTKKELYAIAKEMKIRGRSGSNKAWLIFTITAIERFLIEKAQKSE